jgi:hypothetical protein
MPNGFMVYIATLTQTCWLAIEETEIDSWIATPSIPVNIKKDVFIGPNVSLLAPNKKESKDKE